MGLSIRNLIYKAVFQRGPRGILEVKFSVRSAVTWEHRWYPPPPHFPKLVMIAIAQVDDQQ